MSWRSAVLFALLCPLALVEGPGGTACFNRNSSISARAKLVEILGPCRFLEGRITVGFAYAHFDPAHPGPRISKDRQIMLRKLSREVTGSTPEAIADRALLKLLDGDSRQAVQMLETASAAKPSSAALLSDLAAVYLEDAKVNNDPYSRVKALEAAENAVTIDPNLREARFNRALALDSLFLRKQAKSAWNDYLKLDERSGWARESRDRKKAADVPDAASRWALQESRLDEAVARNDQATVNQIVKDFPQASREYAEERLLGDWARAELARRREEAIASLNRARAIGVALVAANGERMVADTVESIDRAMASRGSGRRGLLAHGHTSYQAGLRSYAEGRFAEAREQFARARDALSQAGSPFSGWAVFRLAVAEVQLFRYGRALEILAPLLKVRFRSLAGRALWVKGLIFGIQAKPEESLAGYRAAIQGFAALGESENVAFVRSLVAECLTNLGDRASTWAAYLASFFSLIEIRDPARRQTILERANWSALREGKAFTALDLLREATGGDALPPTAGSFYCLRQQARTYGQLRNWGEAQASLKRAESVVSHYPDEAARKSLQGDLALLEGMLLDQERPGSGLARLTAAIGLYKNTGYRQELAFLYAERARSYRSLNQLAAAERDFKSAIDAIREQRGKVLDESLRSSYMEDLRAIFDDMVALQIRLGRWRSALDYAEGARAQILRELMAAAQGDRARPLLTSEDMEKLLPPGVALIEFSVLPKSLLVWILRRGSLRAVSTDVDAEEVRRLVGHFRKTLQGGAQGLKADGESRALARITIGKLAPFIQGVERLVIVPDRALYGIPFAALRDEASGNYLIQRYALSIAPSANTYFEAAALERSLAKPGVPGALVVGNPDVDPLVLPGLPRLASAEQEARAVAALYPSGRLVVGREATRDVFFEGMRRMDVIHFAGHSVANLTAPQSSFLALASSGDDSGILYARDIYKLRRARPRLVILSSCGGLAGIDQSGEGVASLARPFLAVGIPAVVGSLWNSDDRYAGRLLRLFHQAYSSGAGAAASLRWAQIQLLSSGDPLSSSPANWAGFELMGSGAIHNLQGE